VQVGINADLTWTNVTGVDDAEFRGSWAFGAYVQVRLSEKLFIVPALMIKTPGGMKGFGVGEAGNPFEPSDVDEVNENLADGTITRTLNYITVPVAMRYQIGRIGLAGGGYAGYMTKGHDELDASVSQGDLTLRTSVTDVLNRFDAGLQASVDFSFMPERKMRSLRLAVKGIYGLMDTVKDNSGDPIKNVACLSNSKFR